MRFRDFVISACALALTMTLCAGAWLLSMSSHQNFRIDHAALNAIQIGMTRQEVDAIMGGPPGDYTGGRFWVMRFT